MYTNYFVCLCGVYFWFLFFFFCCNFCLAAWSLQMSQFRINEALLDIQRPCLGGFACQTVLYYTQQNQAMPQLPKLVPLFFPGNCSVI